MQPTFVQYHAQIVLLLNNLELLMRIQERVRVRMAKIIENDNLGSGHID